LHICCQLLNTVQDQLEMLPLWYQPSWVVNKFYYCTFVANCSIQCRTSCKCFRYDINCLELLTSSIIAHLSPTAQYSAGPVGNASVMISTVWVVNKFYYNTVLWQYAQYSAYSESQHLILMLYCCDVIATVNITSRICACVIFWKAELSLTVVLKTCQLLTVSTCVSEIVVDKLTRYMQQLVMWLSGSGSLAAAVWWYICCVVVRFRVTGCNGRLWVSLQAWHAGLSAVIVVGKSILIQHKWWQLSICHLAPSRWWNCQLDL